MRNTHAIIGLAVALCLALAAHGASAQDKKGAKKHFEVGLSLMHSEDYNGAVIEFEESIRIYKTKGAMFNLANCYKVLRRYADALAMLGQLEESFGASLDREMRDAVDKMTEEIGAMIGTLEVTVDRDGATILVDGKAVGQSPLPAPLALGPGLYEIRAEAEGFQPAAVSVKLVSGEKSSVVLSLSPAAPATLVVPAEPGPSPAAGGVAPVEPGAPIVSPAGPQAPLVNAAQESPRPPPAPRPSRKLLFAGVGVFAGGYIISVAVGAIWYLEGQSQTGGAICTNCDQAPKMYIPLVGPFLVIPKADGTDGKVVAGVMGGVQVVGFCLLVGGIVKLVLDKKKYKASLGATARLGEGPRLGFGASLTADGRTALGLTF